MPRVILVILIAIALAGCARPDTADPDPPATSVPATGGPAAPFVSLTPPAGATSGGAPTLPIGRSWTYAYESLYDGDQDITVVVARGSGGGYLFAGKSAEDLSGEVLWGRQWLGPHDSQLMDTDQRSLLFSFPLEHGKSWEYRSGLTVTATAATVATPSGSEPGFVIEGRQSENDIHVRAEYAPSVGYFTSFLWEGGGRVIEKLTLKAQGVSETATWFRPGPSAFADGTTPTVKVLDVPAGFDLVLMSGGAENGGRVALTPPLTSGETPWTFESEGAESWSQTSFEAFEGRWSLSAASGQGFAMGTSKAVAWLPADLTP